MTSFPVFTKWIQSTPLDLVADCLPYIAEYAPSWQLCYELQSQVNLFFLFCREMGLSSLVLMGHDDGGLLALMAAERAQSCRDVHQVEVKGVVLVGVSLTRSSASICMDSVAHISWTAYVTPSFAY